MSQRRHKTIQDRRKKKQQHFSHTKLSWLHACLFFTLILTTPFRNPSNETLWEFKVTRWLNCSWFRSRTCDEEPQQDFSELCYFLIKTCVNHKTLIFMIFIFWHSFIFSGLFTAWTDALFLASTADLKCHLFMTPSHHEAEFTAVTHTHMHICCIKTIAAPSLHNTEAHYSAARQPRNCPVTKPGFMEKHLFSDVFFTHMCEIVVSTFLLFSGLLFED